MNIMKLLLVAAILVVGIDIAESVLPPGYEDEVRLTSYDLPVLLTSDVDLNVGLTSLSVFPSILDLVSFKHL